MLVAGVGGMGDYRAGVGCDMLVAGVGGIGDYRAELLQYAGGWWLAGMVAW